MTWTQVYVLWGNWWLTTLLAALPIIVLFTLLAGLRVKPHWCAIAGAATAVVVAVLFFKMPAALAGVTFLFGGAIGTPIHTLAAVTALPESDLNAMAGRILPFTAVIVSFWLVRAMVGWKETFEVLPAILVVGFSFGLVQFYWSNYIDSNLVDIMGGVASLVATVIFLRFWH